MDLSKFSRGDRVVVVSAVVFFVSMFLPWFSFSESFGQVGVSYDWNGFDVGFAFGVLPMLLAVAMAAAVIVPKVSDVKLPAVPGGAGRWMLIAGLTAAVCVLLKLAVGEDFVDRAFGLFVAAAAAVGLAAGGLLVSLDAPAAPAAVEPAGGGPSGEDPAEPTEAS